MIFPVLYNGPVSYYARLIRQSEIVLEQHDSYVKQSYRNRCKILGPNGIINISIPVIKEHGIKTKMQDVQIDYKTNWNKIHWKSLQASYASSPFFEYYVEELKPFYSRHFNYLLDLTLQLTELNLGFLDRHIPIKLTEAFSEIEVPEKDPRFFIHPKKKSGLVDNAFLDLEYHQVFSDRHGFSSDLSILDLLFNLGPDAASHLGRSLKT